MKPDEKVLDKLKKILKLAQRGATQGEVEAAMASAKAIAMRHSIDLSEVDMTEDTTSAARKGISIDKDSTLTTRSVYKQPYHGQVFWVMEKVFDIKVVYTYRSEYGGMRITHLHLVGEVTDVAIAKVMYPFLEKIFPKLLSKQVSAGNLTYCAAHTNGFYRGLAAGIVAANEREKRKLDKDDANKYAMVLVKKEDLIKRRMAVDFPKLKEGKDRRREMDYMAAEYGRREGQNINLRQVEAAKPNPQIK